VIVAVGAAMEFDLFERYSSCQPTDMELVTTNLGEPVGLRTVEVMELLRSVCTMRSLINAGQQKLNSLRENREEAAPFLSFMLVKCQVELVLIPLDVYYSCNWACNANHRDSYIGTVLKERY